MEGQQSTSNKGQAEGESNSACSPLTLPGDKSEKPGNIPPTVPSQPTPTHPSPTTTGSTATVPTTSTVPAVSPFPFPTDAYVPSPLLRVIRPLTSTGLVSPPPSLPLVHLPDHPPLSPIQGDFINFPSNSNSPASVGEQVDRLAVRLEHSHIQEWLHNLSPAGEPEWDTYFRTPPTYNTQREFWDSRHESFTGDSEISGNLFSPLVESHQPDFQQIELVDTVTSDLDSESDLVTCVSKRADMSTSDSTEAHARQRETYLREFEVKLKHNKERLLFKISDFTEDDLDSENVKQVEVMLKEIGDEHVGIAVNIQGVIEEYRIELGVTEVEQWEEAIADQSRKVKAHAKKIRAKAEQITPTRAISAFESEMLQAQKATAEAQIKLVELELKKQDRESKESRALVSSKALELKPEKILTFERILVQRPSQGL